MRDWLRFADMLDEENDLADLLEEGHVLEEVEKSE